MVTLDIEKPPTILNYSWRTGKIFGVPVDVHWTFLLVPPAILYFSFHPGHGLVYEALTWYASVAVLLFIFVLVHELGHAVMAKFKGVRAEKIILFPLGGGALIPERPDRPLDEILIYAAGPATNLLLAAAVYPILLYQPEGELVLRHFLNPFGNYVISPTRAQQLLGVTIAVNGLLAVGNLLPAYPLDGGRILGAILRRPLGERPATVIVATLGVAIGLALIYLGYLLGDPLLGIGAGFIVSMSIVSLRSGWQRRRLSRLTAREVARPIERAPPVTNRLYTGDQTSKAIAQFNATGWPVLPVYDRWNELRGFVAWEVIEEEDPDGLTALPAVAELGFVTARPGDSLLATTEKIVAANVYGAAVVGRRGVVTGFVFTEDVMRVLGK